MDWLAKYDASINCRVKEVTFRLHGMDEFTFCRSNVRFALPLLSAVQAIKNVRDGAQAYSVYVQAKPKTRVKLEDIMIVCHYSDVFSEITGLPPDREVEHPIDLVLGT